MTCQPVSTTRIPTTPRKNLRRRSRFAFWRAYSLKPWPATRTSRSSAFAVGLDAAKAASGAMVRKVDCGIRGVAAGLDMNLSSASAHDLIVELEDILERIDLRAELAAIDHRGADDVP